MSKKILYSNFTDTESIINEMISSPEMQKAMKRRSLYNFWEKTVGKKMAEFSKPYSMMGKTLVVACQNPAVAQELLFQKNQIIDKMKPYLNALHLTLTDIKFDTKKWDI